MIFAISIHHRPLAAQLPIDLPLSKTLAGSLSLPLSVSLPLSLSRSLSLPPCTQTAPSFPTHINMSVGSQGQIRRGADIDLHLISLCKMFLTLWHYSSSHATSTPPGGKACGCGCAFEGCTLDRILERQRRRPETDLIKRPPQERRG